MRNITEPLWDVMERYGSITDGTIAKHYRSITEPLWGVMEALRNVTKALWDNTERYGAVMEHCRELQNITEHCEHYGTIRKRYRSLREHYGAVMLRYGTITENIDFAHVAQNAHVCCIC